MSDQELKDQPDSGDESVMVDAGTTKPKKPRSGKPRPVAGVWAAIKNVPSAISGRVHRSYDGVQARPLRAVRILGIVVVAMAVVTGVLFYQARQYQLTAQARDEAQAAAKDSVVQVLSYNYRTIDRQIADTQGMLTGKFKDDYAALVRDVISQAAKDTQVAIQTSIVDDSVVSSRPDQVVLLMYLNQQSEGKATGDNPILTGSRLRVTLDQLNGKWLISELTPV